ncbi:hypothetical protein [Streptomyces sp. TLI_105]|uniref:hypothetical protein n=1 Tax=Streptomyces sp. TLI_105 TaxID=1881019 RepID=UPI000897EFAC|nr:hypothetical protein [Streptomyces sp. TLI_105]SEE06639.1 hypothetical protein SAMN05428939_7219 [Streptomyces sp. TLI_105]
MTPGRWSRGVRAALFAAVCVLLASTGHVLMSGQDLPAPALGLAFVGTLAVAWVLAGRERGLSAVTTAAVVVQGLLHAVFSGYQRHAPVPMPHMWMGQADRGDRADMAHLSTAHLSTGRMPMDHMSTGHGLVGHGLVGHGTAVHATMDHAAVAHDMTDMSSSLGMLTAHLLAAFLSGLWMAYGERAVFRLVRTLPLGLFRPVRLLLAAVVPVPPRRARPLPVRAGDERAPRRLLLAHSVISRGPPRAFAVV